MRKYETPKIEVDRYDLSKNIMDGYIDGDIWTQPDGWGDLFESGENANSILD